MTTAPAVFTPGALVPATPGDRRRLVAAGCVQVAGELLAGAALIVFGTMLQPLWAMAHNQGAPPVGQLAAFIALAVLGTPGSLIARHLRRRVQVERWARWIATGSPVYATRPVIWPATPPPTVIGHHETHPC